MSNKPLRFKRNSVLSVQMPQTIIETRAGEKPEVKMVGPARQSTQIETKPEIKVPSRLLTQRQSVPNLKRDVDLLNKKMKFRDSKPIIPVAPAKRDGSSSLRRPSQIMSVPKKLTLNNSLRPRHSVLLQPSESFGAEREILATEKDRLEHIKNLQKQKTVKRGALAKKSFEESSSTSSYGSDDFDQVLDRRVESVSSMPGTGLQRISTSIASAEQLFEPRIYANRLLGRKINLKDVVIMKNVNGKIVTTIKPKGQQEVLRSNSQTVMQPLNAENNSKIKKVTSGLNLSEIVKISEQYKEEQLRQLQVKEEQKRLKKEEKRKIKQQKKQLENIENQKKLELEKQKQQKVAQSNLIKRQSSLDQQNLQYNQQNSLIKNEKSLNFSNQILIMKKHEPRVSKSIDYSTFDFGAPSQRPNLEDRIKQMKQKLSQQDILSRKSYSLSANSLENKVDDQIQNGVYFDQEDFQDGNNIGDDDNDFQEFNNDKSEDLDQDQDKIDISQLNQSQFSALLDKSVLQQADPTTQKKLEIYNRKIAQIQTYMPEIRKYVLSENLEEYSEVAADYEQIILFCLLSRQNLLKNYFEKSNDKNLIMFGKQMYLEIIEQQNKSLWSAISSLFLFPDGVMSFQICKHLNTPITNFIILYISMFQNDKIKIPEMGKYSKLAEEFYNYHYKKIMPNLETLEQIIICQNSLTEDNIYDLEKMFLNLGNKSEFEKYVFNKIYSKILMKFGEQERVFTMLQVEFSKTSNLNLLYLYGKLVIKSNLIDYFSSAQCAMLECQKSGCQNAAFYMALSYLKKDNKIKAIEYYQRYLAQNMRSRKKSKIAQEYIMELDYKQIQIFDDIIQLRANKTQQNWTKFLVKIRNQITAQQSVILRAHLYYYILGMNYQIPIALLKEETPECQIKKIEILADLIKNNLKIKVLKKFEVNQIQLEILDHCKIMIKNLNSSVDPETWFQSIFLAAKLYKNIELGKYLQFENPNENPFQKQDEIQIPENLVLKALSLLEGIRQTLLPINIDFLSNTPFSLKIEEILKNINSNKIILKQVQNPFEFEEFTEYQDVILPITKFDRSSIPRATILKKMEKISLMKSSMMKSAKSSMVYSEYESDNMDEMRKSFFDIMNSQFLDPKKSLKMPKMVDTNFMAHTNLSFLLVCSKICMKKADLESNILFYRKALQYMREYELLQTYFGQKADYYPLYNQIIGSMAKKLYHKQESNYFENILL